LDLAATLLRERVSIWSRSMDFSRWNQLGDDGALGHGRSPTGIGKSGSRARQSRTVRKISSFPRFGRERTIHCANLSGCPAWCRSERLVLRQIDFQAQLVCAFPCANAFFDFVEHFGKITALALQGIHRTQVAMTGHDNSRVHLQQAVEHLD